MTVAEAPTTRPAPKSDPHRDGGLGPDRAGCRELPDLHRSGRDGGPERVDGREHGRGEPDIDHAVQRGRTFDHSPVDGQQR